MPVRRVATAEPDLPPVLDVTPQGIGITNSASGWPLATFAALVAVAAAVGAVAARPPVVSLDRIALAVVLVLAAAISGGMTFRAEGNYLQPAPTLLYVACAAIVLGPPAAVLAGAFAGGRSIRWPREARVFSAALGGLQGVAAALVAASFAGTPWHLRLVVECGAVAAAGGAVWAAGQGLMYVARRLPDVGGRLRRVDLPSSGAEVVVAVAATPPIILLDRDAGILSVIIFIAALITAFGLFRSYRAKLLDLHGEVERLAQTDPLTDAANRRAFDDRFDQELQRVSRGGEAFGLLLIDADHFKQLNDGYGHAAGDHVLTELSRRLAGRLRQEDLLARIGGDEFAVIVTNARSVAHLESLARALQRLVAGTPFVSQRKPIHVTISTGVALADDPAKTRDDLLQEADSALYRDKDRRHGRTRIAEIHEATQGSH